MFKSKYANAGWSTIEEPTGVRRQSQPAGRDYANDVATRKRQHVTTDLEHSRNEAVGTRGDILRRFAAGTTVAKQFPAGLVLVNIGGQFSLVDAVIPLHQIRVCLSDISEAGQYACPASALHGLVKTCENENCCNRSRIWRARFSPSSFNGRSVRPVLRRASVHSVSPCLARYSLGSLLDTDAISTLARRLTQIWK
jgi:hypothetical protein